MEKEELFNLLKENLRIENKLLCYYPNRYLITTIRFNGEKVCETKEIIGHDY